MTVRILQGDCRERMAELAECSVDTIVCDPPYGLGFMGKGWDHAVPGPEFWIAALRVAKPGAHLVAFGGTRTFHRLACAIEDAGWEIRDTLGWLYGSGFPKSHNGPWGGTALKPAWEPIILARQPLSGTVAANVQAHGTGALNIDGCRVETTEDLGGGAYSKNGARKVSAALSPTGMNRAGATAGVFTQPAGRWPANILHDGSDEVLGVFPDSAGQQGDLCGHSKDRLSKNAYGDMRAARDALVRGDSGSAARFFWSPKASTAERNLGLGPSDQNRHPTVKPVALMPYLCRLVCPPGGVVLDPFAGSGSTGIAASREGFSFIGIDLDVEHCRIAERRITGDAPLLIAVEGAA